MWIDIALLMLGVSVLFVIGLYLTDRYEKEPPQRLLYAFLLGMTSTLVVILLKKWLLSPFAPLGKSTSPFFRAFIEASLFEEAVKLAIIIGIFYRLRDFSEPMDGIIYGAFVAAGFAYVENILYTAGVAIPAFSSGEKGAYTRALLWMTALRSIPGHILFNAISGYFIGMAKFTWSKEKRKRYFVKAILSAYLLHGIFDFLLMSGYKKIFFLLFLPSSIIWLIYLIRGAWKISPYNQGIVGEDYILIYWPEDEEERGPAWIYLLLFSFPVIAYALFLLLLIGAIK